VTTGGILPDQRHWRLFEAGACSERPLDADQIQPASLDLRLGATAYRVRASFMPGKVCKGPTSSHS
jgi:dCTP deaminase